MSDTEILLVWLDVETTGLDPDRDTLLEVACTLSDVAGDTGEHPVFEVVLPYRAPVDADIAVMHGGRGGLLDVCRNVPGDRAQVLAAFDAHLAGELAAYDAVRMLAGHSIHFDRRWLDVHMPLTAAMLSHRIVDVRSLVTAARAAGLDRRVHVLRSRWQPERLPAEPGRRLHGGAVQLRRVSRAVPRVAVGLRGPPERGDLRAGLRARRDERGA